MLKTVLLTSAAVASATDYSSASPENLKMMFENFKKTFNKVYREGEDEHRFLNFVSEHNIHQDIVPLPDTLTLTVFFLLRPQVQHLRLIDQRNAAEREAGGSAVHDISLFADMSEAEFASRYLQARPNMKTSSAPVADVAPYSGSSTSVDWTGIYTYVVYLFICILG